MKIVVINGTQVKGCTYRIKEIFLDALREGNTIKEYYLPKDLPHFCVGCKNCFFKSEEQCPHAEYVMPIWNDLLESDLLVFAAPVYALRTTAQMKTLLDHLCVHWMVHRPDERMRYKRAVILTNAIGMIQKGAQKDVATSLRWLGVSDIKALGLGLMEGVVWKELSEKRRGAMTAKIQKLASKYKKPRRVRRGIKNRALFFMTKLLHQAIAKKENPLSADSRHWVDKGWIKG
ncbi:MAG: flavodoxin family protein [Oscillospiraceae bacterium]|jgi:multimeric flavodoxin WrbA|nr:flavodoxin family protein [Oscillospiraceae bacterium]